MPERPNTHVPWKLPVLAPLWIIQIALAVLFLVGVPIVKHSVPEWRNGAIDLRYATDLLQPVVFINCYLSFQFSERRTNVHNTNALGAEHGLS